MKKFIDEQADESVDNVIARYRKNIFGELADMKQENENIIMQLCDKMKPGCVEKKKKKIKQLDEKSFREKISIYQY